MGTSCAPQARGSCAPKPSTLSRRIHPLDVGLLDINGFKRAGGQSTIRRHGSCPSSWSRASTLTRTPHRRHQRRAPTTFWASRLDSGELRARVGSLLRLKRYTDDLESAESAILSSRPHRRSARSLHGGPLPAARGMRLCARPQPSVCRTKRSAALQGGYPHGVARRMSRERDPPEAHAAQLPLNTPR